MTMMMTNSNISDPLNVWLVLNNDGVETRLHRELWPRLSILGTTCSLIVDLSPLILEEPKTMLFVWVTFRFSDPILETEYINVSLNELEISLPLPHTAMRVMSCILEFLNDKFREYAAKKMNVRARGLTFTTDNIACSINNWLGGSEEKRVRGRGVPEPFFGDSGVVVAMEQVYCQILTLPTVLQDQE